MYDANEKNSLEKTEKNIFNIWDMIIKNSNVQSLIIFKLGSSSKVIPKNIDVYKLNTWVQSPVLLQSLNMVEKLDIKSMGFNSTNYIHNLYQIMNLAFSDRDFYYGDPYYEPKEPVLFL